MRESRRQILILLGCAAGAAILGQRARAAQNEEPGMPWPEQDASQSNPNASEAPADPRAAAAATKAMLEQNQKDIKKNVEKLYKLASELKEQVEKTDSTAVLSLSLVRKAEQIEKLAKQIKERAKG